MKIKIKLFGSFRKGSEAGVMEVDYLTPMTVRELKIAIEHEFQKRSPTIDLGALVARSVLATEDRILLESEGVVENSILSILPPVCGG